MSLDVGRATSGLWNLLLSLFLTEVRKSGGEDVRSSDTLPAMLICAVRRDLAPVPCRLHNPVNYADNPRLLLSDEHVSLRTEQGRRWRPAAGSGTSTLKRAGVLRQGNAHVRCG